MSPELHEENRSERQANCRKGRGGSWIWTVRGHSTYETSPKPSQWMQPDEGWVEEVETVQAWGLERSKGWAMKGHVGRG